jgi:hypothetical protein
MDMIEEILYILGIIATFFGVVQGIPWLVGAGPKSKGKSLYLYYDWEKKALVEGTEYEFSWGWVLFLRKIFLVKTSSSTECKLSYKSALGGPKNPLPRHCFVFRKADSKDKIMLVKNDFFGEKEIDKVYVHATTPEDQHLYEKNINVAFRQNGITIENKNDVEIRNYVVTLPDSVNMDKLLVLGIISGIIVPDPNAQANDPLKIRVKRIEPKEGDDPFVLTIPYFT